MAKFFCLIFSFKLSRKFDRCTAIAANVSRLCAGGASRHESFNPPQIFNWNTNDEYRR